MPRALSNFLKVETLKKIKVETTYEYVPILGEILGYWKVQRAHRFRPDIEIHILTPLDNWGGLYINGEQIDISSLKKKE